MKRMGRERRGRVRQPASLYMHSGSWERGSSPAIAVGCQRVSTLWQVLLKATRQHADWYAIHGLEAIRWPRVATLQARLGLTWLGLAWLGWAGLGLTWLGLAWLGWFWLKF